jgi:4a-hydroxytetrahydrobiopterin dehydratase
MPSPLAQKKCIPCKGGTPPLAEKERNRLLKELGGGWVVENSHHLAKEYPFKNFVDALAFTNRVGAVAEQEGHHPDIFLTWGKVGIKIWTHVIDGLTESDFVLAAKADAALEPR